MERTEDLFERDQVFEGAVGWSGAEECPAGAFPHDKQAAIDEGPSQNAGTVELAEKPVARGVKNLTALEVLPLVVLGKLLGKFFGGHGRVDRLST